MSRKKYFTLKTSEYISFYIFMFGGMSLHFLYYEGRIQEIVEMSDKYLLFLGAIFLTYMYFVKKAKDYRKQYILEKGCDVYGDNKRLNGLHQWTPVLFILSLTFLEFNFLKIAYYSWFYFILLLLTSILIMSIVLAKIIGNETKNKQKEVLKYETK